MALPIKSVVLKDFTLTFKAYSRHNGVATILPCPGSEVPGALWEITPACLKALDRYEGYPTLYDRFSFDVVDSDGKTIKVMSYAMVGDLVHAAPSNYYLGVIKEGYKNFGLDLAVLDKFVLETI